jgi:hypothetical protein
MATPPPTMNSVLRTILTYHPDLPADGVIKMAKSRGVTQSDASIRHNIYNIRSDIRKKARTTAPATANGKPVAVAAKSAARITVAPKSLPSVESAISTPVPASKSSNGVDLTGVFGNVTLVNAVVTACGGVDQARQVAEAVRACGTVEAFLQHLDLVASLRASAGAAE